MFEKPQRPSKHRRTSILFLGLLLVTAVFVLCPEASEVMVAIADHGPGTEGRLFRKPLAPQSDRWTTGPLLPKGRDVIMPDLAGGVLFERSYRGDRNGYAKDVGPFILARRVMDGQTTTIFRYEEATAAIQKDGWTPTPGPRSYPFLDGPSLSPDLRWLAFIHARPEADASDLWVCEMAHHQFTKISDGNRYDEMPAWSPDSTRLAFYRTDSRVGHGWGTGETTHPAYALWVWDRRTSQSRQVAPPGQYAYYGRRSLVWSPDGTKVLHQWASDQSKEAAGLYLVDVNTGETRRLSQEAGPAEGPVTIYLFSPDGRRVLYGMRGHLFMVGSDGRGRVPVLAGRPFARAKWDTDESRIFVLEVRGDHCQWSSARPDGSDLQPIVPPPGYRIVDVFTYME